MFPVMLLSKPMKKALILAASLLSVTVVTAQDASTIELKPSTDATKPLAYDKSEFTAKAGSKIKLVVNNTGSAVPQPHNVVLCKPDTDGKVSAASMGMMTDPNGMAKAYVPESPDIIASTKFAQPGSQESVEVTLPAEPGDYPFFCTFPGHSLIMKGVLKVTP
jgi:azurin